MKIVINPNNKLTSLSFFSVRWGRHFGLMFTALWALPLSYSLLGSPSTWNEKQANMQKLDLLRNWEKILKLQLFPLDVTRRCYSKCSDAWKSWKTSSSNFHRLRARYLWIIIEYLSLFFEKQLACDTEFRPLRRKTHRELREFSIKPAKIVISFLPFDSILSARDFSKPLLSSLNWI